MKGCRIKKLSLAADLPISLLAKEGLAFSSCTLMKLSSISQKIAVVFIMSSSVTIRGLADSEGTETFFPQGFTQPKMATGGGGSAIAGPTPFFNRKTTGSQVGVKSINGKPVAGQPSSVSNSKTADALRQVSGNTDLMLAAVTGDTKTVKSMLAKGRNINTTNINAVNQYGSTALMGASAGGYEEIVQALLEKGANVNIRSRDQSTALMFAARNGHAAVVRALLAKGADVTVKNNSSQTAATLAVDQGHDEVVAILNHAPSVVKSAETANHGKETHKTKSISREDE